MSPDQQAQFNQELSLVVAIATQLCPKALSHVDAVDAAIALIRTAETNLKRFYDKQETPAEAQPEPPVPAPLPKGPSRKVINEAISTYSRICVERKLKTQDELVAMVTKYGVKRKEELTDEQATELLEQLRNLTKEK